MTKQKVFLYTRAFTYFHLYIEPLINIVAGIFCFFTVTFAFQAATIMDLTHEQFSDSHQEMQHLTVTMARWSGVMMIVLGVIEHGVMKMTLKALNQEEAALDVITRNKKKNDDYTIASAGTTTEETAEGAAVVVRGNGNNSTAVTLCKNIARVLVIGITIGDCLHLLMLAIFAYEKLQWLHSLHAMPQDAYWKLFTVCGLSQALTDTCFLLFRVYHLIKYD